MVLLFHIHVPMCVVLSQDPQNSLWIQQVQGLFGLFQDTVCHQHNLLIKIKNQNTPFEGT